MTYTSAQLKEIIEANRLWAIGDPKGLRADLREADLGGADLGGANLREANLYGANLRRADLYGADLGGANLREANLREANLYGANLRGADLYGADLREANLREANLCEANLGGADLGGADLREANLRGADLYGADLREANLGGANLRGADLYGADLGGAKGLAFQIPQEGELIVFKKLVGGKVAKLLIPSDAQRTATPIGRKCRAEYAQVIDINGDPKGTGLSSHDSFFAYTAGELVRPDSYNGDFRLECTNGVHFFQTREEAEAY